MRTILYFTIGILFGITLFKSEAASWFRIYEMFQFKSFHMYGIIGSALVLGVFITQSIKRFGIKSFYGCLVGVYSVLVNIISFLLDTSMSSHYVLLTKWLYLRKMTS